VENGVNIFIAVGVGVLLVIQAAVFIGLYLLARRVVSVVERVAELQTRAEYLLNNTEPVVTLAHHLMTDLKEASGYFAQGAEQICAITEMARDEVAEVRSLLGDTTAQARREVERAKGHVQKVQETLATATDEFEKTTALVQRSILEPAREFSYLMFGLRRALEVLVTRNRLPVNRVYQDEEMFI
jgi:hypothetical protein